MSCGTRPLPERTPGTGLLQSGGPLRCTQGTTERVANCQRSNSCVRVNRVLVCYMLGFVERRVPDWCFSIRQTQREADSVSPTQSPAGEVALGQRGLVLSNRPTVVLEDVRIDLPDEDQLVTGADPTFATLHTHAHARSQEA
jgi:hypothetical protein